MEGLALGRLVRKLGFWTDIGRRRGETNETAGGICLSACAYGYLGGVYRFHRDDSKYGVHRFSSQVRSHADLEVAQVVSSAIVSYLREMEVDTAVFDRSSSVAGDSVHVLNSQDLRNLKVVNDGKLPAQWTIEATQGGYYLRGEQRRWTGPSKLVFGCSGKDRTIIFYPFYGPVTNANEIKEVTASQAIKIDGNLIPLRDDVALLVVNDTLQSISRLDAGLAARISSASNIGWVMNHRNGFLFVGTDIDIDNVSRAKVQNFFSACLK